MSYNVHNFRTGETIEAGPFNEMDQQIQTNESNIADKANSNNPVKSGGVYSALADEIVFITDSAPVTFTTVSESIVVDA